MKQKTNSHPLKTALIYLGVISLVSIGYFGFIYVFKQLQPVAVQPGSTGQQSNVSTETPDAAVEGTEETAVPVNTINNYQVAADMPRFLTIDSLGMKARIQQMGVNSVGAVQAPVNIYDSGWYKGSAKPGTSGAAFIDGHASGATRQGLFAYIDTLENGDTVKVEQGDGTVFTYKVVHVETVSKDGVDMNKALQVYGGAQEGLNLMTCTGKWIANEETYDKRAIVYTQRVS